MEIFRLVDILHFLRSQRSVGYQGVNVIIELFESKKNRGFRKRMVVLSALHSCNLFELGHPGVNFTPDTIDGKEIDIDSSMHERMQSSNVRYQIFDCYIRNGGLRFDVVLN